MKNQKIEIEKAEKIYLLACEVAGYFLGMFPDEELSRVFTDSVYEEFGNDIAGISKTQLYSATRIVIDEMIEKKKLSEQALKDIMLLLPNAYNGGLESRRTA